MTAPGPDLVARDLAVWRYPVASLRHFWSTGSAGLGLPTQLPLEDVEPTPRIRTGTLSLPRGLRTLANSS